MKKLLLLLMLIPAVCYSQDSVFKPMEPDSINLALSVDDNYIQLKQEGVDILAAGIVMHVTSFGLLFSGPLSDIGVGTIFTINQSIGLTLDIVGIVKIIRAKKKRNKP